MLRAIVIPIKNCTRLCLIEARSIVGAGHARESRPGDAPTTECLVLIRNYYSVKHYNSSDGKPCCQRAELTVFAISMAMVIGPTPPGTGVIAEAISETGP